MRPPLTAREARGARPGDPAPFDVAVLAFDERCLRRKLVGCAHGGQILVDLAKAASLEQGTRLVLEDGRHIEVIAAEEDLAEATGPQIARLAWHVGNRHAPCQVEEDRLLIARDHVLEDMLRGLGATVRHVREPFSPEGGAYGHGSNHGTGRDHG